MKAQQAARVRDTLIASGLIHPDAHRMPMPVRENVKQPAQLSRLNAIIYRRALTKH